MPGHVGNISFDKIAPTAGPDTAFFVASAAIAAVGALTLVNKTNDIQRRVAAVSDSAGDTTQTLAITGTNSSGTTITETLTLTGVTPVYTKLDFKTVSSIVAGGTGYPTAGNVKVGQNGVASSPWRQVNNQIKPVQLTGFIHILAGTINCSVETTMDDPNAVANPGSDNNYSIEPDSYIPPIVTPDLSGGALVSKATDAIGTINAVPFAYRLTMNSYTYGTGVGASLQMIQAGLHE